MARVIRKTEPTVAELAATVNDLKDYVIAQLRLANADLVSIAADAAGFATPTLGNQGSHNDVAEYTITAADASTLATSLTLVNAILKWYETHMADTLGHKTAGVALASYAKASDLATAQTRANDIKAKYETHRASTTYHYVADATNTIAAADASDQGTLNTLLNELKADLNLHGAAGCTAKSVRAVSA